MSSEVQRIVREYQAFLEASPGETFPLLCPVGEYDWIPQWQCEMVYSQSGFAELGCVFTTDFGDGHGRETWVVCKYLPGEMIGFVRTGPHRTTRYEIILHATATGTTILWRQELTALDSEGIQLVARYTQEVFERIMQPLNAMLNHYLKTGGQLNIDLDYTAVNSCTK